MKKMIPVTVTSLALASCCLHEKPTVSSKQSTNAVVVENRPDDYDSRQSDSGMGNIQPETISSTDLVETPKKYDTSNGYDRVFFFGLVSCIIIGFVVYFLARQIVKKNANSNGNPTPQ